jgi:hypothetical protein
MAPNPSSAYLTRRPLVLGLAKVLFLSLGQLPLAQAAPIQLYSIFTTEEDDRKPADDPSLWLYLGVAAALVLLGGAFAGLTIALMGQVSRHRFILRNQHTYSSHRMRYIFKSFESLEREPRNAMQARCFACSREANTGSWLLFSLATSSLMKRYLSCSIAL